MKISTTLVGFNKLSWRRGNRDFVLYKPNDNVETLAIVDKDTKTVQILKDKNNLQNSVMDNSELDKEVSMLMNSKISYSNISMSSINFKREMAGIWGFQSPKEEFIDTYKCKVWKIENIILNSKTRTEHLLDKKEPQDDSGFEDISTSAKQEIEKMQKYAPSLKPPKINSITFEEYFDKKNLNSFHLGREMKCTNDKYRTTATLWMAPTETDDSNIEKHQKFPMPMDQVLPILEMAALSSEQLASKLKEFFSGKMPPGFPVQIIVPIYSLIYIQFTFKNFQFRNVDPEEFQIPTEKDGYSKGVVLKMLADLKN